MGNGWSNIWVFGLIIVVCIIGGIITFRVLKVEENKQKEYEKSGDTAKDELARSLEYEKSSLKSNIPLLSWIYIIAIVVSIIAFAIYMF